MNSPKVSIIIPTYNAQEHLKECLDSVANQTLKDIEIICIDDKSTDNTVEILREYASKDSRFKIIEQEINQGPGINRNIALDKATGDYIMFLDADDMFELSACEDAYNQIIRNNNDIVFFNHFEYQDETSEKTECKETKIVLDALENEENIDTETAYYCRYAWDKIYKHDFLKTTNCKFAEALSGEARYFTVRTIIAAKSISVLNKPLYYYRLYSKENEARQQVNSRRVEQFNKNIEGKKMLYDFIKNQPYNAFSKLVLTDIIRGLIGVCISYSKKYPFDNASRYIMTRNTILEINSKFDIEELRQGMKYVSPSSPLSKEEIETTEETQVDNGIIVIKIDKKLYKQYKNFIKYKNWFEYKLFVNVLPNIRKTVFSVKNEKKNGSKHKVITVLGIKIKAKK